MRISPVKNIKFNKEMPKNENTNIYQANHEIISPSIDLLSIKDIGSQKKLIPETVKAWASKAEASDISVLLSENDLAELKSGLTSSLKSEIEKGLEIKPDKTLSAGFRIGVKNGAAFYDYSAESLAEMFSAYLNPKVAALMKVAAEDAQ